ncbi:MAG: hypothetical protein P4L81_01335 [Candidatus Pacebacteria bacterium]|nr:hypothetical protein [Candidatus Paceibacterota bacterium]
MLPYRDSKLTRVFLICFFIAIALYAYFEARGILFGPTIQLTQTATQVSTPYVEITGTTAHIATLTVNGQGVPVTEAGAFDIPFALSPGFNRIVLDASDKYGHSTEKVLQIVYSAPSGSSSLSTTTAATSTSANSTISTSSRQSASSTQR